MHIYTHTFTHVYTYMYMYTYTQTKNLSNDVWKRHYHRCTYASIYICMHIHIYMHIHICAHPAANVSQKCTLMSKKHLYNAYSCTCTGLFQSARNTHYKKNSRIFIQDDVKLAQLVSVQNCPSPICWFDSGKTPKPRELESTWNWST